MARFDLTGRRALVTGGSRGLGRAMALGLVEAGARVASLARTEMEDTDGITSFVGDVDRLGDIPGYVDAVENCLGGGIDLVLHAAGVQHRSPAVDFPDEEWDRLVRINLTSPFRLSKEIGRRQLERGTSGSHLFIASLTSTLGLPNIAAYSATKSGVMGVVRTLSTEWSGLGVRVNAIGPGYFRTALTEALFSDEKEAARLAARIPMGRFGSPDELAGTAIYLLSDASSYVTGQLIYVDGGWTAA